MPTFQYKAKMKNAETIVGQLDAETKDEAVERVHDLGLVPVAVELKGSPASRSVLLQAQNVSSKEVYFFTRQLASLIKSGIPILRILELISSQIRNPYFKTVIQSIRNGVKEGRNFSDCLGDYPKIFSNLYIMMIRAGEESGNLKATTKDMADYLQKEGEVASKVRSAIAYPVFMAVFGLGTVIFILTYVMPKITGIFSNFNQALPLPTQLVMGLSDLLIHYWVWPVLLVLAIAGFAMQWPKTKAGRIYIAQLKLGTPLFGPFWVKTEMGRFCRTLELLLKSGIPIVRAIALSVPIVENEIIQDELKKCQEDILAGRSLGQTLKEAKYVPPLLGDLIMIGEESGSLSGALNDIAENYEQDANEFIKTTTTLLEPAMILVVGSVIGFIVIAMLLPIFELDVFAR